MVDDELERTEEGIEHLIEMLCSLIDGETAIEKLIACGNRAIPHLESFLIDECPRVIAQPRCWAVHVLGELGACSALQCYLQNYVEPEDSAVRFAEDAVRSAAADELSQWRTEENFRVLSEATERRASQGLVRALAAYEQAESIPLFFQLLEDDFCREEALRGLLRAPANARSYAILLLRGQLPLSLDGLAGMRRRRGTLKLLREVGTVEDWHDIEPFLADEDVDCVLETVKIGLANADSARTALILAHLLDASPRMNWAQELETTEILDAYPELGRRACRLAWQERYQGSRVDFQKPHWRILWHVLGSEEIAPRV